jgi:FKBP-type peptidyl-prolyl cis-trans isomerase
MKFSINSLFLFFIILLNLSSGLLSQTETLEIKDIKIGEGKVAKRGNEVKVHYTGYLASNNTKFDSSVDRKTPFEFKLGRGEVIAGWDRGIVGMKVGGKRKLIIPPILAYGEKGSASIPPNSTLIFDVELLAVE